jgi:hypothetical protein
MGNRSVLFDSIAILLSGKGANKLPMESAAIDFV